MAWSANHLEAAIFVQIFSTVKKILELIPLAFYCSGQIPKRNF
jgi:hypothetical protein